MLNSSLSVANRFLPQPVSGCKVFPRFGQRSDEVTADPAPIAIIDNFTVPKNISLKEAAYGVLDIDGDEIPDLPHGVVVARILQGLCPEAVVVPFDTPVDASGEMPESTFLAQLRHLEKQIEDGLQFSAINISLGNTLALSNLKSTMGQPLQENELHEYTQPFKTYLCNHEDSELAIVGSQIIPTLERIAAHGIPVYIGGGNEGPGRANLYNLATDTIGVKATDYQGKLAHYSADNSLLQRSARGDYAVAKIPGGFDLTGDGKVDVRDDEVSGGTPVVGNFNHQPAAQVVADEVEHTALFRALMADVPLGDLALCRDKVFSLLKLVEATLGNPALGLNVESLSRMMGEGEYVYLGGAKPRIYQTGPDGRLHYNPDCSGRANLVNAFSGTSWAAPAAIAEDIQAKRLSVTA